MVIVIPQVIPAAERGFKHYRCTTRGTIESQQWSQYKSFNVNTVRRVKKTFDIRNEIKTTMDTFHGTRDVGDVAT